MVRHSRYRVHINLLKEKESIDKKQLHLDEIKSMSYDQARNQLNSLPEENIVRTILESFDTEDLSMKGRLFLVIKDLKILPMLPENILNRLDQIQPNTDPYFALVELYLSLPFFGYDLQPTINRFKDEYSFDLEQFKEFLIRFPKSLTN